jgi:hypothetical protein
MIDDVIKINSINGIKIIKNEVDKDTLKDISFNNDISLELNMYQVLQKKEKINTKKYMFGLNKINNESISKDEILLQFKNKIKNNYLELRIFQI